MSDREFTRAAVLRRVAAGDLTVKEATPLLGVSYRQAKRPCRRLGRRAHPEGQLAGELVTLPDGSCKRACGLCTRGHG